MSRPEDDPDPADRPHVGPQDDVDAHDRDLVARQRRRTVRGAIYAGSLALLLWAASVVPLPYTEYVPGEPTSIPPLLEVSGTETTELTGDAALLTVLLQSSTTRTAIGALLDSDRRLRPTAEVVPADVDRDDFLEQERLRFRRQFEVAAAVGAEAAGVEVMLGTVPLVVEVMPDGPADQRLLPGDVVRAIAGEEVEGAEELQQRVREHEVGETINVEVVRREEAVEVEVTLEPLEAPAPEPGNGPEGGPAPDDGDDPGDGDGAGDDEGVGGGDGAGDDEGVGGGDGAGDEADGDDEMDGEVPPPGMGIFIETVADRLELPFDLTLAETRIGGPSAGLMIALTVYDLLAEEDLIAGRTIHGTGSIDAEGSIGPVGGVPEKMRAAAAYDADLVLVPRALLDDGLQAAPEGLEVVGVDTFDEALEALRETQ